MPRKALQQITVVTVPEQHITSPVTGKQSPIFKQCSKGQIVGVPLQPQQFFTIQGLNSEQLISGSRSRAVSMKSEKIPSDGPGRLLQTRPLCWRPRFEHASPMPTAPTTSLGCPTDHRLQQWRFMTGKHSLALVFFPAAKPAMCDPWTKTAPGCHSGPPGR